MKSKSNDVTIQNKWPRMSWDRLIDRVAKIVFQLIVGDSTGTCFAVSIGQDPDEKPLYVMFATAWHVVKDIKSLSQTIYFIANDKKTMYEAKQGCYAIFPLGPETFDTALIMIKNTQNIILKKDLLPIYGPESQLPREAEVGIVGFPGIVDSEFCFFKGSIAGYLNKPPTYLVDAVGINGVSGGPAFDNHAQIIGLVSSYIPNRIDEHTTLPGLLSLIPVGLIHYWMESKMNAMVL
jgi:hypothetical protein